MKPVVGSLVRDEWESKQKELEGNLSALLGAEWHASIDAETLYPMGEERFAKESPGAMFRELVFVFLCFDSFFLERENGRGRLL